jgi:replicative DNA helicase
MSDFRGSGEIEQEADIMIGIHRPARAPHTRELWVLKQRNGPTDGVRVDLTWDGPSARFTTAPPQPADWSDPGRDE